MGWRLGWCFVLGLGLTACSDDLGPGTFWNVVDTIMLGALSRTPVSIPSGYIILLARSGNLCSSLSVSWYAKLEVLDIDSTNSTVQFQVLTNDNCGYRSLEVGVPYQ